MLSQYLHFTLQNFSLVMFALAIVISLFFSIFSRALTENIFRWVALIALGFTGVYTFVLHAIFPDVSAAAIGWATSPFQFEVAVADLAIGVLGILAFRPDRGFRAATVIAATIWLWGDAIGHIHEMITNHNFAAGNAGSWFWMDIIVPLVLIITYKKLKPRAPQKMVISSSINLQK